MADIYTVTGKIIPTEEPFKLDVEFEPSAELLKAILKDNPNIENVSYEQRF